MNISALEEVEKDQSELEKGKALNLYQKYFLNKIQFKLINLKKYGLMRIGQRKS